MAIVDFVSGRDFDAAVVHVVGAINSAQDFEKSVQAAVESGDIFRRMT